MVAAKYEKRRNLSEMAEVKRLEPFQYLNMVGDFAERFGLDPDFVYMHTSFDTITNFAIAQKEKSEYDDRYQEAERLTTPQP
jgi:hypothetical protein